MAISLFLAKVMSIYFLLMTIIMIVRRRAMLAMFDQVVEQPAVLCMTAVFTLILGILLVVGHNIWVADWRIVITILAWLTLIKGVVNLLFPTFPSYMMKRMHNNGAYISSIVFMLIVGLFLLYQGFGRGYFS